MRLAHKERFDSSDARDGVSCVAVLVLVLVLVEAIDELL